MKRVRSKKGEQWRKVKDYDKYLVSNYGRVYSENISRLLKPDNSRRYLAMKLTKDGKSKNVLIHKIVAQAFVPNPDNKPYIHHKDVNVLNNHADNLMWVTMQEHIKLHRELRQQERQGSNDNIRANSGSDI